MRPMRARPIRRHRRQVPGAARRRLEQRSRPPHHHLPARLRSRFPLCRQWRVPMRALAGLIAAALLAMAAPAAADPTAAPGYALEIVQQPGAIFAGLARDGDALLVTDLAAGRLYRRGAGRPLRRLRPGPAARPRRDRRSDRTLSRRAPGRGLHRRPGLDAGRRRRGPLRSRAPRDRRGGGVKVLSSDFWNPFDFVASPDGFYVVDAARNTIERLSADGGVRQTLFTFARLTASGSTLQAPVADRVRRAAELRVRRRPDRHRRARTAASTSRCSAAFRSWPAAAASFLCRKPASRHPRGSRPAISTPRSMSSSTRTATCSFSSTALSIQSGAWVSGQRPAPSHRPSTGARQIILDGLTRPVSVLIWDDRHLVVSELGGSLYFLTRNPEK